VLSDPTQQSSPPGEIVRLVRVVASCDRFCFLSDDLTPESKSNVSVSGGSTLQVRVDHKKENFNVNCYNAYYSVKKLFYQISG
jgi:hypothetical protein